MARFGRPNSPAYASLQTVALAASIVAVKARRRKTSRRQVAAEKGERTGFTSFRLDAGEFDDLAPLLGLVGDQFTEIGGRPGKQRCAKVDKPRSRRWVGKHCVDRFIERVDDFGGRSLRGDDAIPRARLITGHKIGHVGRWGPPRSVPSSLPPEAAT